MNVLVVGLGGVGGFLGVKLADAYRGWDRHKVFFLAKGPYLRAVLREGITLVSDGGSTTVRPLSAREDAQAWPPMDLILLCVKGQDLQGALESVRPVVTPRSVILPLQNGIGKRLLVEETFPRAVVADGAVYVFAHIASPGVILHVGGPGRVVWGRDSGDQKSLQPYHELLLGAGIRAELVPRSDTEVWGKFVVLAAIAGTTALYGETVGQVMADPEKVELIRGLMEEVAGLGRASGVPLAHDLPERSMELARGFPPDGKSSLLHDLEAGRPSELDWLLGRAVGLGQSLGVEVPLLRKVYQGIVSRWFGARSGTLGPKG